MLLHLLFIGWISGVFEQCFYGHLIKENTLPIILASVCRDLASQKGK